MGTIGGSGRLAPIIEVILTDFWHVLLFIPSKKIILPQNAASGHAGTSPPGASNYHNAAYQQKVKGSAIEELRAQEIPINGCDYSTDDGFHSSLHSPLAQATTSTRRNPRSQAVLLSPVMFKDSLDDSPSSGTPPPKVLLCTGPTNGEGGPMRAFRVEGDPDLIKENLGGFPSSENLVEVRDRSERGGSEARGLW
ncbi:hypothetical protein Nepgr_013094 [Nepenthes gracilis]|uniref:Uncharacterized protein n=1 Tax=Nepenthes gracilis TaxID=150966 RepID=A0AAD3SH90_NEPGR|nr:hypothetical protein Nepgr_013094 [Nepenthes gracilis]